MTYGCDSLQWVAGRTQRRMSQTEVRKVCYLCGADVAHTNRHKNRHGQYVCMKCVESKKRSPRNRVSERLGVSPRFLFLYVALALVGCWLFYRCLDMTIELMTAI